MMTTEKLAPYVLRALAEAQQEGRCIDLETLALALKVRRPDVRKTVSALHQQGLVDALRLRLSLAGFAMGAALLATELPPIRRLKMAAAASSAA
jgi:DNA-binding IclR family transcriptional regulator